MMEFTRSSIIRPPPQKFHQHRDAFAAGHDARKRRRAARAKSRRRFARRRRGKILANNVQFGGSDGLPQFFNCVLWNCRPAFAEMNDAARAARVLHLAQGNLPVELREEISGEQRLRHPDRALARGALEADARQENVNAVHLPQMRRRDVLVLGLGTKAEPRRIFIFGQSHLVEARFRQDKSFRAPRMMPFVRPAAN